MKSGNQGLPVQGPTPLLPVAEARRRIVDSVSPVTGRERLALRDGLGRVLAEAIVSPLQVPAFDNSAMDGYALRAADLALAATDGLALAGRALAGAPHEGAVGPGQCVRIMTGAVLPAGADTVVMQEQAEVLAEGRIRLTGEHRAGENVRRAGEDVERGQTVLESGRRLTPADIAVIASLGIAEVQVHRRPRVAFFSTGDELCAPGQPLQPGQIYDSNRYALSGMLRRAGVECLDLGVVPDRREAVEQAFRDAATMADAVITSGGVSVGEADFVKETLERLGQVDFWRIRMKPGKPLAFGRVGDALFFGLPGNPVSTMVTFYQFVQPALQALAGAPPTPPLRLRLPTRVPLRNRSGRTDFQRGRLCHDDQGRPCVTMDRQQGSHILTSMSQADCFIVLPPDAGEIPAGTEVEVEPFAGLI